MSAGFDHRLTQGAPFKYAKNTHFVTDSVPRNLKRGELTSISVGCQHILPLLKGQVIGANKINPEIGQVVFHPQNAQKKYLR